MVYILPLLILMLMLMLMLTISELWCFPSSLYTSTYALTHSLENYAKTGAHLGFFIRVLTILESFH
jgi:hypothetical protein